MPGSVECRDLAEVDRSTIVDIREQDEWDVVHIPGTVHIPMSELPQRWQELDPDGAYNILCAAGGRSIQVCIFLEQQGLEVFNVEGGLSSWHAAGLEVEVEDKYNVNK